MLAFNQNVEKHIGGWEKSVDPESRGHVSQDAEAVSIRFRTPVRERALPGNSCFPQCFKTEFGNEEQRAAERNAFLIVETAK